MTKTEIDAGLKPGQSPVVLYGALRSGTTLFRIMLKAHGDLFCPGETDFLFDHISRDPEHPTGWRYDLEALRCDRIFRDREVSLPDGLSGRDLFDHMLGELEARSEACLTLTVHRNAEKLAELLPDAFYLHLVRDPRDVARSSVGMGWAGISYYGVGHWIGTERGWTRLARTLEDGQHITVRFEDLMTAPERELGLVCDFLGLSYRDRMLDYQNESTYARVDPATAGKWRRAAPAREIALIESRLGDLLKTRGYSQAGHPVHPGGPERLRLRLENNFRRWRFNIRRFGLPLFVGTHAVRIIRIPYLQNLVMRRREAVIRQTLK